MSPWARWPASRRKTSPSISGASAWLRPVASGLTGYPAVRLSDEQASRFCMGQRQRDPVWPTGLVAVFDGQGQVRGLGQVDDSGLLAPQRRFNL